MLRNVGKAYDNNYYDNITEQPEVNSIEQFGTGNVTVTFKWAQEAGVSYNISIVPQVDFESIDYSTVAQLWIEYNVMYNVSIVSALCGRHTTTKFSRLYYGELYYCTNTSLLFMSIFS